MFGQFCQSFQTFKSTGLDSLEKEPVTLSGNHVISAEQLFVGTIRKGESGVEFKNVYSNRENRSMFDGMADALTKIRLASPGQESTDATEHLNLCYKL